MVNKKIGIVMIYTGNGKGKTTASLGLALRAIGHGQKAYMIQFMKGGEKYGEITAIKKHIPDFEIVQKGLDTFVKKGNPSLKDIELAKEGFELAKAVISEGKYDLVILDEINVAVDYGLIGEDDVLGLISEKPDHVTIVLTGRYASRKMVEAVDMVSEIKEVKHHFQNGIQAQPGIEY